MLNMTLMGWLDRNLCCGYSLEEPHRGTSIEYSQHMFASWNKKNVINPSHLELCILNVNDWSIWLPVNLSKNCWMSGKQCRPCILWHQKHVGGWVISVPRYWPGQTGASDLGLHCLLTAVQMSTGSKGIRVFADRIFRLQPPVYPKRDKWEPLPYWLDAQADLSLCWSHKSFCRFCFGLAQIWLSIPVLRVNQLLLKCTTCLILAYTSA